MKLDPKTKTEVGIEYPHFAVHQGFLWESTYYDGSVDIASPLQFALTTIDVPVEVHLDFDVEVSGVVTMEIIETPTITNMGTVVPVFNYNRKLAPFKNVGLFGIYRDSVYTGGTGTVISTLRGGSTAGGNNRISGTIRSGAERVLRPDTNYILKITPDANDTKVGVRFEFYYN